MTLKEISMIIAFFISSALMTYAGCFISDLKSKTERIEQTLERLEEDIYLYSLQNYTFDKER